MTLGKLLTLSGLGVLLCKSSDLVCLGQWFSSFAICVSQRVKGQVHPDQLGIYLLFIPTSPLCKILFGKIKFYNYNIFIIFWYLFGSAFSAHFIEMSLWDIWGLAGWRRGISHIYINIWLIICCIICWRKGDSD